MAQRVFISYARTDQAYVDRLARIISDAGFDVWYDRSIETGSSFGDRIRMAIETSAVVIAVLTPESVASKWVLREISYADQRNIPLVPLLLADCEKPIELAPLQHYDVRGGRMVGHDFLQFLAQHAQRRPVAPGGGPRHSTQPRRRSRAWVGAAVAVLALLAASGAATWYWTGRSGPAAAPTPTGPTVSVSKGEPCGEGIGATEGCAFGYCLSYACGYIHVETSGFPGSVSCLFGFGDEPPDPQTAILFEADESRDTRYWVETPGTKVTVVCGGVTGSMVWPA